MIKPVDLRNLQVYCHHFYADVWFFLTTKASYNLLFLLTVTNQSSQGVWPIILGFINLFSKQLLNIFPQSGPKLCSKNSEMSKTGFLPSRSLQFNGKNKIRYKQKWEYPWMVQRSFQVEKTQEGVCWHVGTGLWEWHRIVHRYEEVIINYTDPRELLVH